MAGCADDDGSAADAARHSEEGPRGHRLIVLPWCGMARADWRRHLVRGPDDGASHGISCQSAGSHDGDPTVMQIMSILLYH
jgi:hypothetical protein